MPKGNPNPSPDTRFGGPKANNRSDGRWDKNNSFSYWMNKFKSMSTDEFLKWQEDNPESKRTVAADLAYVRVRNARKELKEFTEVANRTEGLPTQRMEHRVDMPQPILGGLSQDVPANGSHKKAPPAKK